MVHLPIALQLYSVRDDMARDFQGTLHTVRELGYDGVEFAGLHGRTAQEAKDACAAAGLTPISAHVGLGELLPEPDRAMAVYAAVGCRYIAIPYLPEEYRPGTSRFGEIIEAAKVIGAAANRHGLTLTYHNHDFEFVKVGDRYGLDVLYESVSPELLQTQLDTCWVKVGGEDPAAYLRKYAGRAPLVHLKDFVGQKSNHMYQLLGLDDTPQSQTQAAQAFDFRPVGYGVQDFPAIIAAGEEAGAEWFIVEQDMPALGKTPMENAEMSIRYLRNLK